MPNYSEVMTLQKGFEEALSKRMDDLEAQVNNPGSSKDTVARVADELRTFRELAFSIFKLLRQQIQECAKQVDELDTRSRGKVLLLSGIPEKNKEDCTQLVLEICNNQLGLEKISKPDINVCLRFGLPDEKQQRPILIRFSNMSARVDVWRAKTKLKGTSIAVKEFLTRVRQLVFGKARLHFGMRLVWTHNGVIFIKTSDNINKITTEAELVPLMAKYPQVSGKSPKKT